MVSNNWDDAAAQKFVDAAGSDPADRELALRVYTSRLIGQDPDLVMHGGGNTSVKLTRPDLFGRPTRVLHIKGSGWDLASIEAPGLPAVRLEPLQELRKLAALSDEDMVNAQRCNLLDSTSPNPSVEALLHAYLPHTYVDHTHATAFLAIADLTNVADVLREIFGTKMACVPYIMPGFGLAKVVADIFEAAPDVEGIVLAKHGHIAFGDTARESYERIIDQTNQAAAWLAAREVTVGVPRSRPTPTAAAADVLPVLRGVLGDAVAAFTGDIDAPMPVFDVRDGPEVLDFLARADMPDLAARGVATPDHVIRIKRFPLVLTQQVMAGGRPAIAAAVAAYEQDYRAYFDRQVPRFEDGKVLLTPTPNLVWMEGLGVAGIGANAKAAGVGSDLAEQNLTVMRLAETAGGFYPVDEADTFECEYWSLEQAKLGKGAPPRHSGKVVLVTGGAGAIGFAVARAFAALGANVFLVDLHEEALAIALKKLGAGHRGIALDITAPGAAATAVSACVERFGGLDVLVSNAGAAWAGQMADLDDADLRKSFELNFFAHAAFAKATTHVFKQQGRGGQILFNVSKQAVNPGAGLGAYGLPKATTLFLLRQLALELGGEGVRVNGINADRIRSGLLTNDFIEQRAKARGVEPAVYMAGNILKREVEAKHVADAFIALSLAERTTAHVMTVDGGNIEAALR